MSGRPPAWYTLDVAQKDRTSVPLSRPAPMPERQPARSDRGLPDLGRGRIGGVDSCLDGYDGPWHFCTDHPTADIVKTSKWECPWFRDAVEATR